MLDMAANYGKGPQMVKAIAERQGISARYLEQLLFALKMAGLVRSVRGTKGGFVLARPPADITPLQIVEALEGSIAPVGCVDQPSQYMRSNYCVTHDIWTDVKNAVADVLGTQTLADMVKKYRQKEKSAAKVGPEAVMAMCARCGENTY
jgi:Rrf2 family protein